ncbi:MAG: ParB/RepB/Spo0J family partition protein [Sphaerochaetaceae bacterium]|nr:ParB/RepB/Spo0J family partition protein [Sphaerochaetaceae bacterium]
MSDKKLGKGMGSLLGGFDYNDSILAENLVAQGVTVNELRLDSIKPNPNQPRKEFAIESLQELAGSIREHGVLQPILVEDIGSRNYIIVAGERRYRAAKMAGLKTVPAIIRNFSEDEKLQVSLIENIQREDLNPIDEAKAYASLLEITSMTQEQLAQKVGKSRAAIANSVRLLQLPEKMFDALLRKQITAGHARALLSVMNPADQEVLFKRILENDMSVRATEQMAGELNKGKRIVTKPAEPAGDKKQPVKSLEVLEVEDRFLKVAGTRIEIKGDLLHGRVEIPYQTQDELERIYQLMAPGKELFDGGDF